MDAFSDASKKFGLKINIKKTEVLYQPNSTRTREENIMVDGNKLNSVPEFTYPGSTISSDGRIDAEIQRRMAKASTSFGRFARDSGTTTMCPRGSKARSTAQLCYPPYYTEPRPGQCTDGQVKKLHAFMMRHLRSIMRLTWKDKVTNKEILGRIGLPSSDQKESPVDWTPHEEVIRQATKADPLLSIVFWSQTERTPSSPV